MSRENVEMLRAALEASGAGTSDSDWKGTLTGGLAELWDPEIEWDASTHPLPDLAGLYQGREAVLRWWREWLAAWEAGQFEYELVDADDRVVGLFDARMRGRSTGIELASGKYAMVFTFRNGLIVHARFYGRRSEALEAVGLAE
jgi:ketosteroid isomerase-like protein